jgi:hypothetical protein
VAKFSLSFVVVANALIVLLLSKWLSRAPIISLYDLAYTVKGNRAGKGVQSGNGVEDSKGSRSESGGRATHFWRRPWEVGPEDRETGWEARCWRR